MPAPLDIVVISLPAATDRRAHMAGQLAALGLPVHVLDAADGRCLDRQTLAGLGLRKSPPLFSRVPLSPGEVGCYVSHLLAMRRLLEGDAEAMLVLEDDAVLEPDLPAVLAAIAALPAGWDVVKLGGIRTGLPVRDVAPLCPGRRLVRLRKPAYGSHAYVISRTGAQLFLAEHSDIRVPFDVLLDWYWRSGADLYAVQPWPVTAADDLASTIDTRTTGGRWEHSPGRLDRLRTSLAKWRAGARLAGLDKARGF